MPQQRLTGHDIEIATAAKGIRQPAEIARLAELSLHLLFLLQEFLQRTNIESHGRRRDEQQRRRQQEAKRLLHSRADAFPGMTMPALRTARMSCR